MARLAEFVSVKQAAAEKGVPTDTVRRRIARGALPATRVGEVLLIRRRDLDAWTVQRKNSRRRPEGPAPSFAERVRAMQDRLRPLVPSVDEYLGWKREETGREQRRDQERDALGA